MSIAQKQKTVLETSTSKQVVMVYSKTVSRTFLYNTKSLKNVGIMNELLQKTPEELAAYDLLIVNYWDELQRKALIKLDLDKSFVVVVARNFEKDGKKQWLDNLKHDLVIHELPETQDVGTVDELLNAMKALGLKPPGSAVRHFLSKALSCILKSV